MSKLRFNEPMGKSAIKPLPVKGKKCGGPPQCRCLFLVEMLALRQPLGALSWPGIEVSLSSWTQKTALLPCPHCYLPPSTGTLDNWHPLNTKWRGVRDSGRVGIWKPPHLTIFAHPCPSLQTEELLQPNSSEQFSSTCLTGRMCLWMRGHGLRTQGVATEHHNQGGCWQPGSIVAWRQMLLWQGYEPILLKARDLYIIYS